FQVYDGIIFSDVAAFDITPEQMKMVQVLVRDFARGFMMLGGERSFGPGGYFGTPIEETLPVDMDFRRKRITPSTLVMCLIDKSGSMAETVNGTEKMVMAREAAKEVVKLQTEKDWVGVMGFDSTPQWIVEPTQGVNKEDTLSKLSQMQGGGGTDLYPALENAYEAAKELPVQIKHFLIFTDGMVMPGPFEELTARMKKDNITISTVAFGTDADIPFMKELAKAGGGNMYAANSIHDLPRIFTREVFLANKATLNEDPFRAKLSGDNALTSAIGWGSAPLLYGYVATSAKDRALVPLLTHKDDPLLAVWRYGLGKSAAFTSDAKNRWGRDWLDWGGYEKFFTGLARWIRSDLSTGRLNVQTAMVGREGVISVSAVDERGGFLDNAQIEARLTDPEIKSRSVPLRQVGPGEYEGRFEIGDNGNYFVNVVQMAGGSDVTADETTSTGDGARASDAIPIAAQAGGLAVSYSPEYRDLEPNRFLLSQVKAGSIVPEGVTLAGLFTQQRKPAKRLEDAWELFTFIALLLWLLDVAARRLVMDAQDMRLVAATVFAGAGGRRATRTAEQLTGLLGAKERAGKRMPPKQVDPAQIATGNSSSALQDVRARLDANPGGGFQLPSDDDKGAAATVPPGVIAAPPKVKPGLQSATEIGELRKRIAVDRANSPATSFDHLNVGRKDVSPQQAPREQLSDSEVTKRLLERKRKAKDE
ncbi:MAG: VWA domain-containing protein, partial [bacterium]|nr:VWA domain-containing protein [bacterium]